MDDLVEFLRARYDEEAADARAAKPGPWHEDGGGSVFGIHPTDEVVSYTESAAHIARHDPARVLAEVEAKRRIIDVVLPDVDSADNALDAEWMAGSTMARDLLHCLALPYADHPDYQEIWRP